MSPNLVVTASSALLSLNQFFFFFLTLDEQKLL